MVAVIFWILSENTFRIYKKFGCIGRFKPGMTPSKLLRSNIMHHKIRVITFAAVVCLKHFSNKVNKKFKLYGFELHRVCVKFFVFIQLVVTS